jgi:hypothetical protein
MGIHIDAKPFAPRSLRDRNVGIAQLLKFVQEAGWMIIGEVKLTVPANIVD